MAAVSINSVSDDLTVDEYNYTVEFDSTNGYYNVCIYNQENVGTVYKYKNSVPSVKKVKSSNELESVGLRGMVDWDCGYAHYLYLEDSDTWPQAVPLSKKGYDILKSKIEEISSEED
jgi:hypothetical protein